MITSSPQLALWHCITRAIIPWFPTKRGIRAFLSRFEYAKVSIPISVLIWLMIYPMMMKVDFTSIKNVRKEPRGLYVTWVVNWLIKPFTMFGIAAFFFKVNRK